MIRNKPKRMQSLKKIQPQWRWHLRLTKYASLAKLRAKTRWAVGVRPRRPCCSISCNSIWIRYSRNQVAALIDQIWQPTIILIPVSPLKKSLLLQLSPKSMNLNNQKPLQTWLNWLMNSSYKVPFCPLVPVISHRNSRRKQKSFIRLVRVTWSLV